MPVSLTAKQRKFSEVYSGNGVEAARQAGYRGSENTLAQVARENLRKPQIAKAIAARQANEIGPAIADRQARQRFWSNVMADERRELAMRLRASELLGKSEADFVERNIHEIGLTLEQLVLESMKPKGET